MNIQKTTLKKGDSFSIAGTKYVLLEGNIIALASAPIKKVKYKRIAKIGKIYLPSMLINLILKVTLQCLKLFNLREKWREKRPNYKYKPMGKLHYTIWHLNIHIGAAAERYYRIGSSYVLIECERYPCFDSYDYEYESRYYNYYFICRSKKELKRKHEHLLADKYDKSSLYPYVLVDDGYPDEFCVYEAV